MVSVIIVSAGRKNFLKDCLDSVLIQSSLPSEIIVIDNSARPGFAAEISAAYPAVKVYTGQENLFYCQALNKGIASSKGEFLLCLNDDVILDKEFIIQALKGFFLDPAVGMCSGKIMRRQKGIIDSTGLFLTLWLSAGERGYGLTDCGQFQKPGYIFGVNGAVAFYRRKMLDDIREGEDYFDPDFHIFYEDLDIAWRAKRLGWRGYYLPDALAFHLRGGTVRREEGIGKPYARRFLNETLHLDLIRNRYSTIIKNESFPGFCLHLPAIVLYDLIQWCYLLVSRPKIAKLFFLNLGFISTAFKKRRKTHFYRRERKIPQITQKVKNT
ncbi:MAG TPA: glycosyltransferase [Candidatus Margulisiibacteriota bacterium]|nr:glycosyltransferase [Candidatus Margulisiibacteriota bacterium]